MAVAPHLNLLIALISEVREFKATTNALLNLLKTDVSQLKTDVSQLKTAMREVKADLRQVSKALRKASPKSLTELAAEAGIVVAPRC